MCSNLLKKNPHKGMTTVNPIPTGTGLNQPIYSYHVTQPSRNRVKK